MAYSDLPPAPPPPPGNAGYGYGYGPPPQPGPRPPTLINAVRLMFVRVALGIIGLVVLFATKDDLKKKILENTPNASQSTVDAAITFGAVIGGVILVLYALLATQVGKGKNWARIVTWVFAGLGILGSLVGFGQPAPVATRVLAGVELIVDILIVVLLAVKPTNDYFRGAKYRR